MGGGGERTIRYYLLISKPGYVIKRLFERRAPAILDGQKPPGPSQARPAQIIPEGTISVLFILFSYKPLSLVVNITSF